MRADEVPAHFQHHHRQRQYEADPEAARHVGEFGIGATVGGRDLRLQRHAADWAGAGADLPDLGMHRAGVGRAFDHRLGSFFFFGEIFLRISDELSAAARIAKIIGVAAIVGAMLGGVRIDRHAADRIDCAGSRRFWRAFGQIFLRIGEELGAAAVAAEMIGLPLVIGVRLAGVGVDRHATDRIDDAAFGRCVVMMTLVLVGHAHGKQLSTCFGAVVSGGSCLRYP